MGWMQAKQWPLFVWQGAAFVVDANVVRFAPVIRQVCCEPKAQYKGQVCRYMRQVPDCSAASQRRSAAHVLAEWRRH